MLCWPVVLGGLAGVVILVGLLYVATYTDGGR